MQSVLLGPTVKKIIYLVSVKKTETGAPGAPRLPGDPGACKDDLL